MNQLLRCRRLLAWSSTRVPCATLLVLLFLLFKAHALLAQPSDGDWYTAGANASRTSWVSTEVRGDLRPVWYVPIEPYVSPKVQVIATGGRLFLSTSRGLYCFDAKSGAPLWVYPSKFPLGHSPTVVGGVAYVGGFDRRVHAIDVATGRRLWVSPQAGAGFHTSPLVVNGRVIAGNRDGVLYAYDASTGTLLWSFKTEGPILFSAASYGGRIYFASNDSHVYAVSETGVLSWKSAKLPGQGFNSWWPVVYRDPGGDARRDRIIISGSANYRAELQPGGATANGEHLHFAELLDVYTGRTFTPVGTAGAGPGPWPAGTPTLTTSRIEAYLAAKPHRRTVFVLDPLTGVEREKAPVLLAWTHSGTRFPPVVGADGALYQQMSHLGGDWIASGSVAAWAPGVPYIAPGSADPRGGDFAADEPVVAAGGGRIVYSTLCCDRGAYGYDTTNRKDRWTYFDYNLSSLAPGYNAGYYWGDRGYDQGAITVAFGFTGNGVYGVHGDQNPPIPYDGRLYLHRGNSLIAFAPYSGVPPVALPMARTVLAPPDNFEPIDVPALKQRLEKEVAAVIAAGHLRPGYTSHGLFDHAGEKTCGDRLSDYWHTPSDTLYPLLKALPYLSSGLRDALRTYLQNEFAEYPPWEVDHIGWAGAAREVFDTPPEVSAQMAAAHPNQFNYLFDGSGGWERRGVWGRNPLLFYVLWKYAAEFGNAPEIYEQATKLLEAPPADVVLARNPYAANAFIAGYWGYLELEKLAGRPETSSARATLDALIALRQRAFSKDSPYRDHSDANSEGAYCQQMTVASNFLYLVPELGALLRSSVLPYVQDTLNEYEYVAPYWMASLTSDGLGENAISPMYDVNALFQAKALILNDSASELEKYLDVPAFARGDMFYILNLVTILEADDRQP